MNTFFQNLTACAVVGSVCCGLFFLLRHVTGRILGADKQYRFWILLLILWVLPLRFALPMSCEVERTETISSDMYIPSHITEVYRPVHTYDKTQPLPAPSVSTKEQNTIPLFSILWGIWGIGILAALGFQYIPYIRFQKLLKSTAFPLDFTVSHPTNMVVYGSSAVDSPMVVGLFRPILYLPEYPYTQAEFDCILRHERIHKTRGDIPLKWFAAVIRCLHWWNPLAHLTVRQFSEECEISCDFRASAHMSEEQRRTYMKLLLDLAEANCRKGIFLSTGFTDSKQFMKRRLLMIQNGKKQKTLAAILSYILLAGLSAGLIYGSGVFRDTVLPEETDSPRDIPVVDSMMNTEVMPDTEQIAEKTMDAYLQEPESAEKNKMDNETGGTQTDVYTDDIPLILKPDRGVNAEYGWQYLPWKNENYYHKGVDFNGTLGEDIPSVSAGEIVYMGYDPAYGNMVIVKSGSYEICYAHLSAFTPGLAEGDAIEIGTVIGTIGQTGAATGPHLHFEVRLDGQVIDPASVWLE